MDIPDKGPLHSVAPLDRQSRPRIRSEKHAAVSADAASSTPADRVELTGNGHVIHKTAEADPSVPESHEARIMRIRQQLADGTYHIDRNRLAGSLIDEAMENNSLLRQIDTDI
jgi:flagellar biosynthesis anti-sigma factor FlgM